MIEGSTDTYGYDETWKDKLISATDGNGNALAENSVGALNAIRYRGYVYDSETGLYYLQSRYYDPETGRFLNADDVNYLGMSGSVLSYNAFAYCENNPVNSSDPSGMFVVRRWMISAALDFILMLFPIGAWFAPIKAAAKAYGLVVVKNMYKNNIFKILNWISKNAYAVFSKVVQTIKSVKAIKNIKFIRNLSAQKLTSSFLGFALFKTPTYKILNLLIKNVDIVLSLGGFVSGILDYMYNGGVNNVIWVL